MLLLGNRMKRDMIYISSNPYRLVSAQHQGMIALPVTPFETDLSPKNEYQLCLLESYILKHRHLGNMREILKKDFRFLCQRKKEPSVNLLSNINDIQSDLVSSSGEDSNQSLRDKRNQNTSFNYDNSSAGSFAPYRIINKAK